MLVSLVIWALLASSSAQVQTIQPTTQAPVASSAPTGPTLEDGTPVKLRIGRTISSADAHVGDTVDFEVLDEVHVGNLLVIPKGGTAWATVTEAKSKGHMGKGGKLDINIDAVRMADGRKAALRAVKSMSGGGHTGAMAGAMVATSLVLWPAAPLFLLMHGKDITIPKGTEITAFINGDIDLAPSAGEASRNIAQPAFSNAAEIEAVEPASRVGMSLATLVVKSDPEASDIIVDGKFLGNAPSTLQLPAGEHEVLIQRPGCKSWQRSITINPGSVINLNAALDRIK